MKLLTCKTLWGYTPAMGNAPPYTALFAQIKAEGFALVETPIWKIEDRPAFKAALDAAGLGYVAMVNTRTPENLPASHALTRDVAAHVASFEAQLALAAPLAPRFVNAHSGVDAWSFDDAKKFFEGALAAEAAAGVRVVHETHRGRCLYNPWAARDLCRALPGLRLTADFSHFCVVAERVFAADDADWADVLATLAPRVRHIHARVGYAQGPQVNDPRAPEHAAALAAHESWWSAIAAANRAAGEAELTLEPEHGTDGYQQKLPFSDVETADIHAINLWMAKKQVARLTAEGLVE
jgi:hypothetical protein